MSRFKKMIVYLSAAIMIFCALPVSGYASEEGAADKAAARPYSGELWSGVPDIKSCFFPDSPVISSLTNPSAGKVTVSWEKVQKADGYVLISIIDGEETICRIKDPDTTSRTIKDVKDGAVCKFCVKAWKDVGDGVFYSQNSAERTIKAREDYLKISGSGSTRTIELVNPTASYESMEAAVWSDASGQEDLVWYTMSKDRKGVWSAEASASVIEYPGACPVHCYADGEFLAASKFTLTEEEQKNAVNPTIRKYARDLLDQAGWTLRKAYNWSIKLPYQSMVVPLTVPTSGSYAGFNRQELYFVYAYEFGKGNCFCCAASFYWMAREMGYDARLIEGRCKNGAHGWVEIDIGGVTYLFDPETEGALGYDSYMKTYENGPPMEYVKERPY